ncbi:MAG: dienelactone hydrolase family protein [Acidobacteria bacterium]|nr:dienelactone hydrolase family protein [Acidobacteriota bacterium]
MMKEKLNAEQYDPFARGVFSVGVRDMNPFDERRNRRFPCSVWHPAEQGDYPLIIYSHPSGGNRRSATFLCEHLASHGYVVAALDHSEVFAAELARKAVETDEQKAARQAAWIANRVPDVRFLLDYFLRGEALEAKVKVDGGRVGIVGHSFGGWTALAATEADERIRAVVALAPGGSSETKQGMLKLKLNFSWRRDVPTLYLVAEKDSSLPLAGMRELFERTPATKRMLVLRRADHMHFMDNVEELHEAVRAMELPEELSWLKKEMLPISQLCSGAEAQMFARGLALCHMDAVLKQSEAAQKFLRGDLEAELARRGVEAFAHQT